MFKKIDHIELVPTDLEKTLNFFTDILGFKIVRRVKIETPTPREIAFVELNGSFIEMFSIKDPVLLPAAEWHVGWRRIAIEVEDIEKTIEYLTLKRIPVNRLPGRAGGPSTRAEIKDPDGISIELKQAS